MKRQGGFTLFELLIAIFIGTILIMAGAYAIRVGLFSLEKEEVWFNDSTREKAAYDFFWQQTSSLRIQKVPNPNKDAVQSKGGKNLGEKKNIYFIGEKDFLAFVSPLSLARHYGQGLVIAQYKVKLNDNGLWDLVYSEARVSPTALVKLSEESEGRLNVDKGYTVFLRDCDMISFAYLDTADEDAGNEGDAGGGERTNETAGAQRKVLDADVIEGTDLKWKEKTKEKVPRSIKLFVSRRGKEQELISPIMAMYSFSASGQ